MMMQDVAQLQNELVISLKSTPSIDAAVIADLQKSMPFILFRKHAGLPVTNGMSQMHECNSATGMRVLL